ncbi:MAG: hypothetical protein J1F35_08445 [Erysipelotrichales bacterium]|nr:hypothetical protein [Erysipelotrichales bacterium]
MKCPYCDSELIEITNECPHCHAILDNTSNVTNENTSEINDNIIIDSRKNPKINKRILITFVICLIIFSVLLLLVTLKIFNKNVKPQSNVSSTTTTAPVSIPLSKNQGIYSGLENPVNFGDITYATLIDSEHDHNTDVDIQLTRVLGVDEINQLVLVNNQELYPGFKWVGVEYIVTFNDLEYLNGEKILPVLNASLHDTKYKNSFFLVNENYYTIKPITDSNVSSITNGESAAVKIIYQVPVDQNYYLCFGERSNTLGCFNNFE